MIGVTASHKMLVDLAGLKDELSQDQQRQKASSPFPSTLPRLIVLLKNRSIRWFADCSRLQFFLPHDRVSLG